MSNADDLSAIHAIVRAHVARKAVVGDDTPLVSGGLIDSMSIVDLILSLQEQLHVRIPVSEVEPDDFDSVRRIAATVARFR